MFILDDGFKFMVPNEMNRWAIRVGYKMDFLNNMGIMECKEFDELAKDPYQHYGNNGILLSIVGGRVWVIW